MLLETTESPGTPSKTPRGTDSPSGSSDITKALDSLSTFWLSCLSTGSIHTDPILLPAPLGTLTSLNPSHYFNNTAKYTQELNFIDLLGPTRPIPKLIALASHDSSRNWTWDSSNQNHIQGVKLKFCQEEEQEIIGRVRVDW